MKWDTKAVFFEILYIAVAITTFSHTAWSASLVFEGPPEAGLGHYGTSEWHMPGVLMAISIDVGMIAVAHFLKSAKSKTNIFTLVFTFVALTLSSFLFQLLYALEHTGEFAFGPGVTEQWQNFLQPLVDARVWLVPAVLPIVATLFTLAGIGNAQEQNAPEKEMKKAKVSTVKKDGFDYIEPELLERVELIHETNGFKCKECGYENHNYKNATGRRLAIKRHLKKCMA